MADHSLVQWRKQYARLLWRIHAVEAEIEHVTGLDNILAASQKIDREKATMKSTMDKLAARIRQFDPSWDPKRVVPVRPQKRPVKNGTYAKIVYRVLGKMEHPMTTREIALAVAAQLGEPQPEYRRIAQLCVAVHRLLKPKIGTMVQQVGTDPILWSPIPRDEVKLNRLEKRARRTIYGRMPEGGKP